MSQAAYPIFDADGHITESIEQMEIGRAHV